MAAATWFFLESRGINGEYHQLKVIDITDKEVQHVVSSDENISTALLNEAFVFKKCDSDDINFTIGDDVEIFLPEKASWWPARIIQLKDQVAVCQLHVDGSKEIAEVKQLRPSGHSRPLTEVNLFRCELAKDIDDEDIDFVINELMLRLTGPCFPLSMAQPPCVLSLCEQDAMRASLISDALHKKLRYKLQLMRSINEMEQQLRNGAAAAANHVTEQVTVDRQLIGLALGKRGSNVKRARSLPGVRSINFNDGTATFTIIADSKEACDAVRQQLEFKEAVVMVPANVIGRLIGRQGRNMDQIVEKCQLIRVRIGDPDENELVEVRLIGSKSAVDDANFMIDYQIDSFQSGSANDEDDNSS